MLKERLQSSHLRNPDIDPTGLPLHHPPCLPPDYLRLESSSLSDQSITLKIRPNATAQFHDSI